MTVRALLVGSGRSPRGARIMHAAEPVEAIREDDPTCAYEVLARWEKEPPRGLVVGALSYDAGAALRGLRSRHAPVVPALIAARYERWDEHAAPPEVSSFEPRIATSTVDRPTYEARVRAAQRAIRSGEMFEVNLAHRISAPCPEGARALFAGLHERSAGDYAALLEHDDLALASISPELFFDVRGRHVEARPIKGTRPRGKTNAEDEALGRDLRSSAKDRAENVMIVDLLRNDLGAHAALGSVRVGDLCALEKTRSVQHLVSSVTAELRSDAGPLSLLIGASPPGSVTGAPKRRVLDWIDALEDAPRGFYCGSIFVWEPAAARFTASVAIRTATVIGGVATWGTGGAVTTLSEPGAEAEETRVKARPFLDALGADLEGW